MPGSPPQPAAPGRRAAAAVLAEPAGGARPAHPTTVPPSAGLLLHLQPLLRRAVLINLVPAVPARSRAHPGTRPARSTADAPCPLTGHRDSDWAAFAAVYQKVTGQLPAARPAAGDRRRHHDRMVRARLDNNHRVLPTHTATRWRAGLLAVMTSPHRRWPRPRRTTALPPCSSPRCCRVPPPPQRAAAGDIIVAVDGAPPFVGGIISKVTDQLLRPYPPRRATVRAAPAATGRTWTVTLSPHPPLPGAPPPVSAKTPLRDYIAYVCCPGSSPARPTRCCPVGPRPGRRPPGCAAFILDLRGNGGGPRPRYPRLLAPSSTAPAYAYDCDVHGNCPCHPHRDGRSAAAPAAGRATRPELRLGVRRVQRRGQRPAAGTLVGTRTAGIRGRPRGPVLAGRRQPDRLAAGTSQRPPRAHQRHRRRAGLLLPLTAADLSTGRDPDITGTHPARRLTRTTTAGAWVLPFRRPRHAWRHQRLLEQRPQPLRPPDLLWSVRERLTRSLYLFTCGGSATPSRPALQYQAGHRPAGPSRNVPSQRRSPFAAQPDLHVIPRSDQPAPMSSSSRKNSRSRSGRTAPQRTGTYTAASSSVRNLTGMTRTVGATTTIPSRAFKTLGVHPIAIDPTSEPVPAVHRGGARPANAQNGSIALARSRAAAARCRMRLWPMSLARCGASGR